MVPHSWIEKSMEMFGVAINFRRFNSSNMKQWNTELMSGEQRLGNVRIRRGIFQGDSLSPLLFVLAMIPLTLMLRKTKIFYQLKMEVRRSTICYLWTISSCLQKMRNKMYRGRKWLQVFGDLGGGWNKT